MMSHRQHQTRTLGIALAALGLSLLLAAAALAAGPPLDAQALRAQPTPTLQPRSTAVLDVILSSTPYTEWGAWPTNAANPADYSGYLPGPEAHGSAVRVFVNPTALDAVRDPAFGGELPPGSIIVLENYAVTHDDPAALVALSVMAKIDGFYPPGNNWFWLQTAPDGSAITAKGAVPECIACHEDSESDYLRGYSFAASPAALDADQLIATRCTVCHTRERIDNADKDRAGWAATVDRMIGYGAQLTDAERAAVLDFLAQGATGTATTDRTPAPESTDAETLIDTRCTVCHSRERIDAAQKDRAGWAATVDRMIGYGAQLSTAERDVLIDYLAGRGATITVDPTDPQQIINVRCTVCHTRARIDEESEDREDWVEIVDRMVARGAQLTPQERETLLNYLVATHGEDDDDDSGRGRGRGRGGDDRDDD